MVRWGVTTALVLSLAQGAAAGTSDVPAGFLDPPKRRHLLWVALGCFSPASEVVRDTFGASRPVFGIELFRPRPRRGARFDLDLSARGLARDEQGFLFAGLTGGVHKGLTDPSNPVIPFARAHAGPYLVRLVPPLTTSPRLRQRPDGRFEVEPRTRFVVGVNGEAGLEVKERLTFAARYDHLPRVEGFRLSGWTFSLGCRVL